MAYFFNNIRADANTNNNGNDDNDHDNNDKNDTYKLENKSWHVIQKAVMWLNTQQEQWQGYNNNSSNTTSTETTNVSIDYSNIIDTNRNTNANTNTNSTNQRDENEVCTCATVFAFLCFFVIVLYLLCYFLLLLFFLMSYSVLPPVGSKKRKKRAPQHVHHISKYYRAVWCSTTNEICSTLKVNFNAQSSTIDGYTMEILFWYV